jgi:uncharacterized membrane protein
MSSQRPGQTSSAPDAHGLPSLARRNIVAVAKLAEKRRRQRSPLDVAIDAITAFCGSVAFIWIHLTWYGGWILFNLLGPPAARFDPFPFNFLTLTVSLEAIFLSAFILITQNRQARLADLRANLDLQVNLLGEEENTKMLRILRAIQEHLGVADPDSETRELEQEINAEELASHIEEMLEEDSSSSKAAQELEQAKEGRG